MEKYTKRARKSLKDKIQQTLVLSCYSHQSLTRRVYIGALHLISAQFAQDSFASQLHVLCPMPDDQVLAQLLIPSTELNAYSRPVYGNPNPAPLLIQQNIFLCFAAFSRLRTWFCARIVPFSITCLLSTVFASRTPFKYFQAFNLLWSRRTVDYFMCALPHKRWICASVLSRLYPLSP